MISVETNLNIADNSGAKSGRVIRLYGGSHRRHSYIGDIVLLSVKQALPNSKVKKAKWLKESLSARKKESYDLTEQKLNLMITPSYS